MIDRAALENAVALGHVKATRRGSLTLYNYTDRCVFDRAWTPATLAARGLVLSDDGEVCARPFRKFFNLGEPGVVLPTSGVPELADKLDGSLVIVFVDPETNQWDACTRGAFDNAQTAWARRWLASRDFLGFRGWTYLFELVAPWNRIVLPYEREEMVLLGAVDNDTGEDLSYRDTAELGVALNVRSVSYGVGSVDSIDLADPGVRDREGYVARFPCGYRVKLKYETYKRLHKVLTGLSEKGVWELLSKGEEPTFEGVPDEFMAWYEGVVRCLRADHASICADVEVAWLSRDWSALPRREAALAWQAHPATVKAALFRRLDGKPYEDIAWKACRPERHATFAQDGAQ